MKKYLGMLKKCPLFDKIEEKDLENMLYCLSAKNKIYKKNDFIFSEEDKPTYVGIIVSGSVCVVKEDFWGNRSILAKLGEGDLFGEAFSCAEIESLPVSVVASENTEVILIDYKKIITTCSAACVFHSHLINNMIKILANKNIMMTRKIQHIAKRTTREKLLSYLSEQAIKCKSNEFKIPFNRQELADYLSVDRSAMSNELSKMRDEGIIEFSKNEFKIKLKNY